MSNMDESQKIYWVWLQHALGAGSAKPRRMLDAFDSVRAFYDAGRREWTALGIFTQRELGLMETYSLDDAARLLEECARLGHQVLTPESENYPQCLKDIHSPPCVLYVKGELPDVDVAPAIAVVGTRDATLSGRKIAFYFGFQLAKAGAVVVSGGAKGIDTAAHKGALQAGGKTICVLGCGLEYPYLRENAGLRASIAQSGALLSEYPLQTPSSKMAFPIRNRIISGLCAGTLVVEAAAKSGSLITADLALEQGRDVFAVPCGIDNPVSGGVNNLIKNGAVPVSNAADILEQYLFRFPGKIRLNRGENAARMLGPVSSAPKKPKGDKSEEKPEHVPDIGGFSADAAAVYALLSGEPVHISALEARTGLPVPRLLGALTELELGGKIEAYGGRRYSLPK